MSTEHDPAAGAGPGAPDTTSAAAAPTPSGRPGKYQRSAAGLVGALVLTVLALVALFAFTGLFRDKPEIKPDEIDYLQSVGFLQSAGMKPIYPTSLPEGWIATGVDLDPAARTTFGLRMLTDDEHFVGIRQEKATGPALAQHWIDKEPTTTEGYDVPDSVTDPVARSWDGFEDDGGDTGYAAKVGKVTVLVYGSASPEELQQIVDLLTRAPAE